MFDTAVIEVAIGMVLVFLLISMICSAAVEMIAARLRLRAKDLEAGIRILVDSTSADLNGAGTAPSGKSLLETLAGPLRFLRLVVRHIAMLFTGSNYGEGRPDATTVSGRLFNHPLFQSIRDNGKLPSYIPARVFSAALMDYVRSDQPLTDLRDQATAKLSQQAKTYLNAVLSETSPEALNAFIGSLPGGALKDELASVAAPTVAKLREQAAAVTDTEIQTQMNVLIDALASPTTVLGVKSRVEDLLPEDVPYRKELLDFLGGVAATQEELVTKVESLLRGVEGKADAQRREIERWFDESMDRVTGWYKRRTQVILLVLAIPIVVALNADTISISVALWQDDALREAIALQAELQITDPEDDNATPEERLDKARDSLSGFELLGWKSRSDERDPREVPDLALNWSSASDWGAKLAGLIITWLAVSQGAPFWFDILKKLVNVRNAGKPPPSTTGSA